MLNIYSKTKWLNIKVLPFMDWGFLLCSILIYTSVVAKPFSYIYIQGDKTTPFYVKLQGKMQPRYGKNYCIISSLTAGRVDIEIMFQQNVFPAEKFTIDVPENGGRGFLLDKQGESFSLYDLQKKNYLSPNKQSDK